MTTFNNWENNPNGLVKGRRPSDVTVLGAQYDLGNVTVGGGMRMAPTAIRLSRVESLNVKGVDAGDVQAEDGLEAITEAVVDILPNTKRLIVLGGDDSINHAVLTGVKQVHNRPFLIHLDAHMDWDESDGPLDHGNWTSKAFHDNLLSTYINFGARTMDVTTHKFDWGFHDMYDTIPKRGVQKYPVFIALDIDAFDPAYAPGTGWPEPGGFSSQELLRFIQAVCWNCDVVGVSITEVLPHKDVNGMTALLANRVAQIAAQSAA